MTQKKPTTRSALARELISQGKLTPKAIAKRTGLSSQTIYTIKWKMANKQGLGAIKPITPPVAQGTGITSSVPREFEIIDRPKAKKKSNNRRQGQLKRWAREREERMVMVYTPPPTLWQRIKAFFWSVSYGNDPRKEG